MVFIPKCRKKSLHGKIRKFFGPVFRELVEQQRSQILEGHMALDHMHPLIHVKPIYPAVEEIGSIMHSISRFITKRLKLKVNDPLSFL